MTDSEEKSPEALEAPPPILGSWRALYAVVLGVLAGLTGIFYWLTVHFS